MLKENGPIPDAPFEGLEVLIPARDYKNRHASIMLALDASVEAMQDADQQACAWLFDKKTAARGHLRRLGSMS